MSGDGDANNHWRPTGVSFSSGGIRIIGHLGVLAHLLETGDLDSVRNWYGCSGGCICAIVAALGATPAWIRDMAQHFDPRVLSVINEDAVFEYLSTWGVNDGSALSTFMGRFMDTWEPGSSAWTFADFVKNRPGITLTMTATNVSRGCQAIFDHIQTPTMRLVDAVRISSSIPLFYCPWIDASGDVFCDGAVTEYYPWAPVADKANTLVIVCSDTGISGRPMANTSIKSLTDYIGRIADITRSKRFVEMPKNWIAVNNLTVGFMDFDISQEDRLALFDEGVRVAGRWRAFRLLREKDSVPKTPESFPHCAPLHTSCVCQHDPDKRLGTPGCRIPPPQPAPLHSLRDEERRPCRRWSL